MAPIRAVTSTLFSASFLFVSTPAVFAKPSRSHIDDGHNKRVFVKYKSGRHDDCLWRIHHDTRIADSSSSTRMLFDFPDLESFVVNVESLEELLALKNDPEIEKVYEDAARTTQMIHGSIKPHRSPRDETAKASHLRNSRSPSQQVPYGVELVQAPYAWQRGIKGAGVKVCVIDSGIARHEDLDQNGLDGSVASSFWFQGSDEWYDDAAGHGTHVAGTIAAVNNTIGVVGVAPEAELFAVKYFADDSGFAYSSSLVNSAYKCRDAGAKIITMSLGGPLPNPFEFLVFDKLLRENGILSFAAAGNGGGHRPSYPASYNGVISVAAVDRNKAHASFSQRHRRVDISAPGVDVLSLLPSGGCTECNVNGAASGYGTASGTSMATPHVAGVAALLWSFKPEATATEILRAIEDSAVDLGDVGRDDYYGHGLVNAKEALIHLNGGPLAEPAGGLGVASSVAIQRVPTTTSSSLENECDESEVPFGLTIKTDFYGEETSWELIDTLDPSNVVLSGADFEDSKTYEWHKCIPANCYTFVIKDSAEDGLCCDYGSGSYSVSFGGQEIAKSDGVFASRQAVSMGYCDTASANLPVVNVGGSSEPVQAVDATPTDPDATTDEDCVEIGLTFTTDTFPKENRFELVKLSAAGSSPEKIWDHSSFSESETYEYSTCQDPAGCYEFILWDSFGDGLCCRYGDGSFKLSYDGDIVEESDGSFGHKVQVELGSGC